MNHKLWLLLLFWGVVAPLHAQLQFQTIEDVLAYADDHAMAIQGAKIGESLAIAGKKEAQGYLLPSVSASAGYNDNITLQPSLVPAQIFNPGAAEGTVEELTFGRRYLYTVGLQAQWDVLNFQKMFATQVAAIQVNESKIYTATTRFNTYNALASLYYSIVLTQEAIQIYEGNVKTSQSILLQAKEKYEKGLLSAGDLNLAEIKVRQDQQVLSQSQHNLDQFFVQLQTQLNTSEDIQILDAPDQFLLETSEINHPHIEVALQQVSVQKYASILRQKKAAYYPSLNLYYQNNVNWAGDNFFNFSDVNQLPQQVFGLQLSVPIFRGFSTRQSVRQSAWELDLQQQQLANIQLVKQKEDELLQLQWAQASDQLKESQEILELQQESDVHIENRYQSGIIGLDERLNRYNDLLKVQDQYLQSLASLTLSQYKIYIRQIDFQSEHR